MRNDGDTQFNGLLCVGPGNPANGCSVNQKLTVSASNLIIMSGSTAKIDDSTGGNNHDPMAPGNAGSGQISFLIGDVNDQPLPAGTTITAQGSSGVTIGNPRTYTVPCTPFDGRISYGFFLTGAAGTAGQLTLTVEVPSGVQTLYFVPVLL